MALAPAPALALAPTLALAPNTVFSLVSFTSDRQNFNFRFSSLRRGDFILRSRKKVWKTKRITTGISPKAQKTV